MQFDHTMWEAHQWQLISHDGVTVLQDTGRQYSGTLETTFDGLANDADEPITYFVRLQVENNLKNTFVYFIEFHIAAGSAAPFIQGESADTDCRFTANFDCGSQATVLNYRWSTPDNPTTDPDPYSIYRREYEVYERPEPIV